MTGLDHPVSSGAHDSGQGEGTSKLRKWLGPLSRIPTPLIFIGSVSLAVLVLWVQGVLGDVGDAIGDANLGLMLVAVPIYLLSLALLCYRWHALVVMAQGHSDLPRASEAFLTSVVINYAAPIGLAVPSRAALTKRALGLDVQATGTIALWEIGMDVIILGLGSVTWLLIANGAGEIGGGLADSARLYAIAGAAALMLVVAGAVVFLRNERRRTKAFSSAKRIILAPRERPREAALALVTTAIYWIMQGVVLWLLVDAFGVEPSFKFILGLTSIPILVGMLSPVPGGAVVRETLMYVVARLADVPGDPVVAAALVYRFALFAAIPILYLVVRWWIAHSRPSTRANESVSVDERPAQS